MNPLVCQPTHQAPYTSFPLYIHSRTRPSRSHALRPASWHGWYRWKTPFEGTFFEPIIMVQWKKWVYISNSSCPTNTAIFHFRNYGRKSNCWFGFELAELCIHPRCFFILRWRVGELVTKGSSPALLAPPISLLNSNQTTGTWESRLCQEANIF